MKIIEIIEATTWRNLKTNQLAHAYGEEKPWQGNSLDECYSWILESVTFTWRLDNGRIGFGRPSVTSRQEAEQVMRDFNNHLPIQWGA